jgi:hypothetical protein
MATSFLHCDGNNSSDRKIHVLDPCMGWGGRLLGAVSNRCQYIGFEPNDETFENIQRLVHFLDIDKFVCLYHDDALKMGEYDFYDQNDIVLTSPPYFDLEIYKADQEKQSIHGCDNYTQWQNQFLEPLIQNCLDRLVNNNNGISCWNVAKVGKNDMWESVRDVHERNGYCEGISLEVVSSPRQTRRQQQQQQQQQQKRKKSVDSTVVYHHNRNRSLSLLMMMMKNNNEESSLERFLS